MKIRSNFLNRTGYRLPTEAEWVYACRAGATTAWHCGNSAKYIGEYAWYQSNSAIKIQPVGRLKPNDLGLFDIHGNAFEWVNDSGDSYSKTFDVLLAFESVFRDKDDRRIRKGGSVISRSDEIRSADRVNYQSLNGYHIAGFRIARTVK